MTLSTLNVRHGHSRGESAGGHSRTYQAWRGARTRCENPRNKRWASYGGRGITVCDRWLRFDAFLADMGECPDGMTLDRIDNDRGYEPDNCRWATWADQSRNRRYCVLTAESAAALRHARKLGMSLRQLGSTFGVSKSTASACINGHVWSEAA